MIGMLRGKVWAVTAETVLLDVGGVGYEVHVPVSTLGEVERATARGPASRDAEPEVRLFVHTHVREDALLLYGFWTEGERRLFQRLIAVSGIGPRLAQVILSGMPAPDLVQAIVGGDLGRLTRIPGVGKKTAERLVLELRDKARELLPASSGTTVAPPTGADDLVAALVNLGYKAAQAERAVADSRKERPDASFADQLRDALRRLARL
jgi:Holliday junction DNA helicase RuvA